MRHAAIIRGVTVLVGIFVAPVSQGVAATYYVSPSGNNANAGSEAAPWRTIQKAADTMVAGDTVLVRGGIYSLQSGDGTCGVPDTAICALKPKRSGTATSPIVFKAFPGQRPVLRGLAVYIFNKAYVTIGGFEIAGANIRTTDGCTGIVAENNHIHEVTGPAGANIAAIAFNDCDQCIARGNVLHHISGPPADYRYHNADGVLSYNGTNLLIEHNEIWEAGNGVFHKSSASNTIKGMTVRYNYIHDTTRCAWYSIAGAGDQGHFQQEFYGNICRAMRQGIEADPGTEAATQSVGLYVSNNVFADLTGVGIGSNGFLDVRVWNNIFYRVAFGAISIGSSPTINSLTLSDYNFLYPSARFGLFGTSYDSLPVWQAASGFDTDSRIADPLFTSQLYNLAPSSPALGAGRSDGTATGAVVAIGARPTGTEKVGPPLSPPRSLVAQ